MCTQASIFIDNINRSLCYLYVSWLNSCARERSILVLHEEGGCLVSQTRLQAALYGHWSLESTADVDLYALQVLIARTFQRVIPDKFASVRSLDVTQGLPNVH